MFKRYALMLTVFVAAVALLGAASCSKKKMSMGQLEHPSQTVERIG
ncbi:MAG TPA: hypothetical protein VF678_09075 [bacterium]